MAEDGREWFMIEYKFKNNERRKLGSNEGKTVLRSVLKQNLRTPSSGAFQG